MILQSFTRTKIILIDPLQKERNAAAALSNEIFDEFISTCQKFLKTPSENFFLKKVISKETLEKKLRAGEKLVSMQLAVKGKEDVVGAKLVKGYEFVLEKLNSFSVQRSGWEWPAGKAFFYYFLALKELPRLETRIGPTLKMQEFVVAFKKKYTKTYVKGDRVQADVVVEHYKLEDVVQDIMKEEYLLERVRKVTKIVIF